MFDTRIIIIKRRGDIIYIVRRYADLRIWPSKQFVSIWFIRLLCKNTELYIHKMGYYFSCRFIITVCVAKRHFSARKRPWHDYENR